MQYCLTDEESILTKISDLETSLYQCGLLIKKTNQKDWVHDFPINNPDLVHCINDVILPQKSFQDNLILQDYLALCSIHFGYESKTYKRLHPNRRKLYFFWLYRLNFLDKNRLCNHLVDEDDYLPMQSTEDTIIKRYLEPLFQQIFPGRDFGDKFESPSVHICCDNTISELFTCPPCTPSEHGQSIPDTDNNMFCWNSFVSRCTHCGYSVSPIDKKYQNDGCLACYYFETVLNELHCKFNKLYQ